MTQPAEFTAPDFDFNEVEANDAPSFSAPNPKPTRPRWGGAKKTAESKPAKPTRNKTRVTVPPSKPGQFVEDITAIYAAAGMALSMKDQVCGQAVMEAAVGCAEQWDKLAQQNDAVRRALMALTKTTAIGALVAAHAPIIMAVGAHHGLSFGPKPDVSDDEAQVA